MSPSRINNILIPFRQIFDDACVEFSWFLPNPFEYLRTKKVVPQRKKNSPIVFLYDELKSVIDHFDPYYRDHTLLMLHTGIIGSELAGLRKMDIIENEIWIRNSIVRHVEKNELKTVYRERQIPITKATRKILDNTFNWAVGDYMFTMKSDRHFDVDSYRKNPWTRAFKKAGIIYKVPYTLRHTFAAWSLTIGIDPNKLVSLMGHGSKEMVYDVYGKYVKDLEKDRDKILEFFGDDFLGLGTEAVSN